MVEAIVVMFAVAWLGSGIWAWFQMIDDFGGFGFNEGAFGKLVDLWLLLFYLLAGPVVAVVYLIEV